MLRFMKALAWHELRAVNSQEGFILPWTKKLLSNKREKKYKIQRHPVLCLACTSNSESIANALCDDSGLGARIVDN